VNAPLDGVTYKERDQGSISNGFGMDLDGERLSGLN
jgi:hypothetical protein